jgi:SAM-dependent methyltransferase
LREPPFLAVPKKFRRGGLRDDQSKSIESGRWLLYYMADILGHDDLGGKSVLDMGCGVKFTQAILEYDISIGRYVGVDVYADLIDFLNNSVDDPRLSFAHMDSHNEMYNPDGKPLENFDQLPVDEQYDVICLFSVFTHLAPHDYSQMLKLLRPYIKEGGKLLFSLFINERTAGGNGLVDNLTRGMQEVSSGTAVVPDFQDLDKDNPLKYAVYSKNYAYQLISETGWDVDRLCEPLGDNQIQHHFICSPCEA